VDLAKDKQRMNFEIVIRYLQTIEHICVYSLASHYTHVTTIIVSALCGTTVSSQAIDADSRESLHGGYLHMIDKITSAVADFDTFFPSKIALQIICSLSKIIVASSKDLLQTMCSCGIVRTIGICFTYCSNTWRDVVRLQKETSFAQIHKEMVLGIREVWCALISVGEIQLYEDIIECGILTKFSTQWIMSKLIIAIPSATITNAAAAKTAEENIYNPLMEMHEGIQLLYILVSFEPRTDILITEVCRRLISANMLQMQYNELCNRSSKKGAENSRRLAAEFFALMSMIDSEIINTLLIENFSVPSSLIAISKAFTFLHPGIPPLWMKWSLSTEKKLIPIGRAESQKFNSKWPCRVPALNTSRSNQH